jgi:hypothetical protein
MILLAFSQSSITYCSWSAVMASLAELGIDHQMQSSDEIRSHHLFSLFIKA